MRKRGPTHETHLNVLLRHPLNHLVDRALWNALRWDPFWNFGDIVDTELKSAAGGSHKEKT